MKNSASTSRDSPSVHSDTVHSATIDSISESTVVLVGESEGGGWLASAAENQLWDLVRHDSYDEALDAVRAGEADCIVDNSSVPASSSADFLADIRSIDRPVPFLLWTADSDTELLRDILSEPHTTFVPKATEGVSDGVLLNQINEELRKHYLQYIADVQVDAIENAKDGIAILNPDGEYVYVNQAHAEIYGFTGPNDFLGETWQLCYRPQEVNWLEQEVFPQVDDEGEWAGELTARREDGTMFSTEVSLTGLAEDWLICVVRDVSSQYEYQRELETERERFSKLLNAAPDPILVVDPADRTIVESNIAARDIYQTPFQLEGTSIYELPLEKDRDRAEELFSHIYDTGGGSYREYFDGEPIILKTAQGETVPVSINSKLVRIDDSDFIYTIVRPIGEQLEYEDSLKTLNSVVTDLLERDGVSDVAQVVVESAVEELSYTSCGLFEFDSDAVRLQLLGSSGPMPERVVTEPTFGADGSNAWEAYRDGQIKIYNGVTLSGEGGGMGDRIGSEIIVPLGDEGVLLLSDCTRSEFDPVDIEIAELFATAVESALSRAEKVRSVREKHKQLRNERKHLDYVNDLNEQLRAVHHALVSADSRSEVYASVVDSLTEIDDFLGAWIGYTDRKREEIVPVESSGVPDWYLDGMDFDLYSNQPHISAQVSTSGMPDAISNIASGLKNAPPWRKESVDYGVRSVAAVPITYDGVRFGVLVVESPLSSRFDAQTVDVLSEIGLLTGFALNTISQQHSLMNEGTTEMEFDMRGETGVLSLIAQRLGTSLLVHNVVPTAEGSYLIHCGVSDSAISVSEFAEAASSHKRVADVDEIYGNPILFEVIVDGESIPTKIGGHGMNARELIAKPDGGYQFKLTVPPELPQTRFVEEVKDYFPNAEIDCHEATSSTYTVPWNTILGDVLTEIELDTLRTAYVRGYFLTSGDSGTEIAESLGISQSGFSKRIRRSQEKLNKVLWGDSPRIPYKK
ncbi:GAF domain-containing protein [Halorubrum sp. AJ67]|uniref:GAF domain-containing protein n=1 Tax=Halorubrum sp. AJ67 TaxID=1173487 RepID=UPI0003DD7BD7|nr:GAF domain-containing protein [Halorubrum sp. AJ67]CDK38014.1 sensory box protein [Halorubrum sp. AJ67]